MKALEVGELMRPHDAAEERRAKGPTVLAVSQDALEIAGGAGGRGGARQE
ncbi:MAG: hypothetical protein WCA12_04600 [Burkholderiales bacterium]